MNLQAAVLLLALVTTAEGAPSLRFVSVGDWGIGSVAEEKNPGERAASAAGRRSSRSSRRSIRRSSACYRLLFFPIDDSLG